MVWMILTIILAVGLFFGLGFKKEPYSIVWKMNKKQFITLVALLLLIPSLMVSVPTGHTGILTTFGRVEDQTLEAGLHFKLPYQSVVSLDNRTQKSVLQMECSSSDIQKIDITYSVNYQIKKENAQKIYKEIGYDYYETMMLPRIYETVMSNVSQYTAESLVASRDELTDKISVSLEKELSEYDIIVINTSIENMNFSEDFTEAVEEKQVAAQKKLKAEIEQEQLTYEAKQKAERDRIAAEAEAAIAKIQAETEKEVLQIQADAAEYAGKKDAAVNELVSKSLTELLVEYYQIQRWDGKLPAYYVTSSGDVLPILGSFSEVTKGEAPQTPEE